MAQHHQRYWTQFCDYLEQRGSQLRSNTAKSGHYIDFMIDTKVGFRIRQVIVPQPGEVTIQFFMREDARKYYPLFCQQKVEIEKEFGEKLIWLEEKYDDSRVCLIRTDMKPTKDEANWPEQHEWLALNLEKLYDVFYPRLETITTTGDKVTDFIAEFNVNLDNVNLDEIDEVQPSLLGSEPEEEEQEIPEGEHRYFVYAWRWSGDEGFAKIGRTRNGLKGVKNRMVTTYHPTDDPVPIGVRECADAEESHKTERYILNGLGRTRPDREWVEIDEKFNEMIDKSFMEFQED